MVPTLMRPFLLLALVVMPALLAAGCTKPCIEIQQILCTCEGLTQDARNACEDDANAQADLDPPTADDELVCEGLLEGCEAIVEQGCELLQTREGKRACGLAVD